MKKLLTILCIALCLTGIAKTRHDTCSKQQLNNTVALSLTFTEFPRVEKLFAFTYTFGSLHIADQFGLYYYRSLGNNWRAMAGYSAWNTIPGLADEVYGKGGVLEIPGKPHHYESGSLIYYSRYKMCDLGLLHRFQLHQRHKLDAGIAASYAWGVNSYVDTVIVTSSWEGLLYAHFAKASYWGGLATVNYDYLLIPRFLNVGAGLRFRKYAGFYSPQTDYDFHISVNF